MRRRRWDSNLLSGRSTSRGPRREGPVTWNCGIRVVTACARRGPAASDAVRTQRGPARPHPYQRSAPGPVSQDGICDVHQNRPLETAANRLVPMDCGPHVDQAGPLSGPVGWISGHPGLTRSSTRASRRTTRPQLIALWTGYCRSTARARVRRGAAAGPRRRSAPCSGEADAGRTRFTAAVSRMARWKPGLRATVAGSPRRRNLPTRVRSPRARGGV